MIAPRSFVAQPLQAVGFRLRLLVTPCGLLTPDTARSGCATGLGFSLAFTPYKLQFAYIGHSQEWLCYLGFHISNTFLNSGSSCSEAKSGSREAHSKSLKPVSADFASIIRASVFICIRP